MTNKKLFYVLAAILYLAFSAIVWNSAKPEKGENPNSPINPPTQNSKRCGVENCHGLDVVCGANAVDACDMMYQVGDYCRQFVTCQSVEGTCQTIKTQKFDLCKSCVERCLSMEQSDPEEVFECESRCRIGE